MQRLPYMNELRIELAHPWRSIGDADGMEIEFRNLRFVSGALVITKSISQILKAKKKHSHVADSLS